ncbi:phage tail tube protein [Thauera sp.]|uniref:phage tail tube protein n=1 Tax=Thauera sp. TaxID=1905334 RepID=UPI002B805467|nr:phage tail tube protein [Thauera sp.]HRP26019.1 phage tail tube protein [Thauera sp.]
MAKPTTARPGSFIIALGDGGSPEVFTAPCGFTSKAFNFTRNLAEVNIPDCDDPDAPDWLGRDVVSLSASVSGSGVLAAESIETWLAAVNTTASVNVTVTVTYTTGVLTMTGAMQIESFGVSAEQGQKVSVDVSMQSDGEMTVGWTPL